MILSSDISAIKDIWDISNIKDKHSISDKSYKSDKRDIDLQRHSKVI